MRRTRKQFGVRPGRARSGGTDRWLPPSPNPVSGPRSWQRRSSKKHLFRFKMDGRALAGSRRYKSGGPQEANG